MQVNAVSTNSTAFGRRPNLEELEQFAAADDRTLRQVSRQIAAVQVDDKKHKRVSNAIWYSIPLAAGLSAAVTNPKIVGRIPKLKAFTAAAAAWAGTFAVIDATFAAARGLNKHSEGAREFTEKHPVLSTVLTIGATVAALFAAGKGASALVDKYGDKAVKFLKSKNVDKFIKENKTITKVMENVRKAPSALKNFGKGVISWGPMLLIATSLAHTFGHEKARAVAEAQNYANLKANQENLRDALAEAHFDD